MNTLRGISFVDNYTILPESIFQKRDNAWCTFFIQDAKIDMSTQTMKTCEFGLAISSQWGKSKPINKAMAVLNSHTPRLWMMASKDVVRENASRNGVYAVWPKIQAALARDNNNILGLESPFKKRKTFPTPYDTRTPFDPHKMSTYYAIGMTPYIDLPTEHFANITGKHPDQPRILMMDEGPKGPPIRVFNYKHISRLVMNGTAAAPQNPSYVIVETRYTPELVKFLKEKFPHDGKLVLKHVASSRGEGVVILDASSEEALDKQLAYFLSEGSEFRSRNPLSICIIESFISTPEDSSLKKMNETMVRVSYVVLQDNKKVEFYPVAAARCFEDQKSHQDKSTVGMVKIGKFNDGRMEVFSDKQLEEIRQKHFASITAFAQRAVSYDSNAAVEHFLSSDSHILNLIGIELFAQILAIKYRESVFPEHGPNYERLTDKQCELFISLLERNKSPIVRERILENILIPETQTMSKTPYYVAAQNLGRLLKIVVANSHDTKCRSLCKRALIENYKSFYRGFPFNPHTLGFMLNGLKLLEGFEEINRRLRLSCWAPILMISPIMMRKEEGVDYFKALLLLDLKTVSTKTRMALREVFAKKKKDKENHFDLYRYFFRFQKEESSFEKPWSKEDWNALLKQMEKMQAPSDMLSLLWLLPEFLHIGWKPDQVVEILKMYFKGSSSREAFTFFGSLIRFLAHCKETSPDVSFNFMKAVSKFEAHPECLVMLLRFIQEKILIDGMNINQALVNVGRPMAAFISQAGPSRASFAGFINALYR